VICRWLVTAETCELIHVSVKQSSPATRHGGAWGESRYSVYSYLTSALDSGEWSASHPGRDLPPGKEPPVPIGQEAGWAPEPVWTQRLEEKPSASVGDRTPVVQSVVRHYTTWATPTPLHLSTWAINPCIGPIITLPENCYVQTGI
jgi:hypothetical protein